ncbi:MAG: penicillin-binding transpeptidase domain-containing protein [Clostridia bacterium]|nr:penicillin-binding transpeptidase domain-containing protein [Clostridia bacterium]
MEVKRVKVVLMCISISICLLIVRLFYLQIYAGNKLASEAAAQRMANSDIGKVRGNILDRSGIPLTNRSKKVIIALKPLFLRDRDEELKKICKALELDLNMMRREVKIKKEPILFEIDEEKKDLIKTLNVQGISLINSLNRYDGNSIAKHVLGYLNQSDQIGESGIEKSYETALGSGKVDIVGVVTDAKDNLLEGIGYRIVKPEEKGKMLSVRLTLDYHMQKIAESVMDEKDVKGAVVIEDVATGDILAMLSSPDFDQNDVSRYLASPQNALFNRAVASYNLGSIFKIIDTAYTLELNNHYNEIYFCPGFIEIGDKRYKCSSYESGGHGWVDLKNAFASSCNPYFINMGIRAGHKGIIEMARNFGMGSATGINQQGIDEAPGKLPNEGRRFSDGDIANISIGQGEVMATPLQVADIIATVANGGIKNSINLADCVLDEEGNKVRELKRNEGHRIMSNEVAERIKGFMEEVINTGTGSKANIDSLGGAAGKTGSAETGQFIGGEKVVHAWFAGYFPKNNPRYAMSVFIEDGKNGGQAAAPIFAEIAEQLLEKGY